MTAINIDTTNNQYQQLVIGIGTLRAVMTARLKLFKKMPLNKKRQWIQRDELLRDTLKLMRDGGEYIDKLTEGDLE